MATGCASTPGHNDNHITEAGFGECMRHVRAGEPGYKYTPSAIENTRAVKVAVKEGIRSTVSSVFDRLSAYRVIEELGKPASTEKCETPWGETFTRREKTTSERVFGF